MPVGAASSASAIRLLRLGGRGLAQQQALGLDGQRDRDDDQQDADQRGAATSKYWFSVTSIRLTATNAKTRPSRAARSSSRITGSSGCLARRMNWANDASPLTLFVSMIAVRNEKRLQHDGDAEHDQRDPLLPASRDLGVPS